jgi:hypothetical protein
MTEAVIKETPKLESVANMLNVTDNRAAKFLLGYIHAECDVELMEGEIIDLPDLFTSWEIDLMADRMARVLNENTNYIDLARELEGIEVFFA